MAGAILAQDWVTARGSAAGTTVTQQESEYVDLGPYQDAVAFIEVSDVSGSPNLEFQTSPTRDDNLFKQIDGAVSFVPSVAVTTKVMRYSAVSVPLARFFRWKVTTAAGAWSLTFRIWLSPNLG
jgi:hypothetical protein